MFCGLSSYNGVLGLQFGSVLVETSFGVYGIAVYSSIRMFAPEVLFKEAALPLSSRPLWRSHV